MATPTQPSRPPEPGERPGGRRLERPPGERYRSDEAPPKEPAPAATPARGVAWAFAVAVVGAVAIAVLAGALNITVGLLVVAVLIGRYVAVALCAGGAPGRGVEALAAGLAIFGVALGQLGIWLYARSEGGVLELLDYVAQTFGWLVPLELAVAAVAAWWSARSGTRG